ncbi:MAG: AMP-binding protein [Betaproteobacteria bacterium]|nr:AMP-binding protein [Betaproteobacteria bacterium]MBK7081706.1 AMP-binding protein [Betaproteobacteria bacterium]MBK7593244.1 AMP-binding protein [Betaproteobacteria bacterium]MBK9675233.1 AMP-binding protein [Betaproteobacteria bacterium]MBL0289704.1 AMP-binding protein [Betaproteobacteria bacterium]
MSASSLASRSLCLGHLPARHARYRPHHTAVVVAPRSARERELRLDWREFDAYVNRWANALTSLGVCRGDRVATVLPNSLELLATYWACAKLGAAAVPLSPLLTTSGLKSLLADAMPRVVLASSDRLAAIEDVRHDVAWHPLPLWVLVDAATDDEAASYYAFGPLQANADDAPPDVEVDADDLLTLMYTSGTTGLPKGIPHTHFIRAMYATLLANAWRMTPESVVLHTGAIVFNGAMVTLFPAFFCGATYILHRAFDAEAFIAAVESERVTHTMLVPSQVIAILDAAGFDPVRLASLQMILSLGAPLHREHKERLNRLLPDRFHELYGLTEGFVTILDRADALRKTGSVGIPPPFYEMRIVDADGNDAPRGAIGEIVGRGPITMAGYYNRPEATAQALRDGWLHTGDVGYLDEDGYLYLVDRVKDMIDSGGVKVYPKDIEEIAVTHPAVREVAVFGIPDEKWGETPVAAIVLRERDSVAAEDLREWINARVAATYQRLARVIVMDEFPRNAAGKTLKRELRAPFWKDRESAI